MALRFTLPRRLVGRAVAGDEREPLAARRQSVPAEAAPDPIVRDAESAPTRARELGSDPLRSEPGMAKRKSDDPLLDQRRQLVGHLRPAPLARAQHLEAVTLDLPLPAVVGRTVDAKTAASGRNTNPPGQVDQLQPVAEEHVISQVPGRGVTRRLFRLR